MTLQDAFMGLDSSDKDEVAKARDYMLKAEKDYLISVYRKNNNNAKATALEIGISESLVISRLRKYGFYK